MDVFFYRLEFHLFFLLMQSKIHYRKFSQLILVFENKISFAIPLNSVWNISSHIFCDTLS